MSMLDIALECIQRGWYVFPCWPKTKKPMTSHGFKDATLDETQVREWWTRTPDANVAIATGPSGLLVVDVDHGLEKDSIWPDWLGDAFTYTVRTGRRPEFGLQFYFQSDGSRSSSGWAKDGLSGDIRADGGYVMAAGSIHPSGEPYEWWFDGPVNSPPDWVKDLAPVKQQFDLATAVDDAVADGWKTWLYEYANHNQIELRGYEKRVPNGWWLGIRCPWADEHGSGDGTESSTVLGILDGKLAFECSHGTCGAANRDTRRFKDEMVGLHPPFQDEPGEPPSVLLGTGLPMPKDTPEIRDWRTLFHSKDDVLNCPPPTFLIENFLAKQAICAIAAPVAQRKSLIALNMARSLCTGDPLFNFLPVVNRPSRVLYLCPEMGLISFSERVRRMGLSDCVGESLFIRSMNMGHLDLVAIPDEALDGSVLIVDTAIRFMKGDENSSADMQAFSEVLFAVQRRQGPDGAIVILYHSPKATKDASELTLENCMRGSGELGAAITDAHGTRLQDPENAYTSASFIRHIKCRDYEGIDAFEVSGDTETGILTKTGDGKATLTIHGRYKGNQDGKDDAARAAIQANPDKSVRELVALLADLGIKRGKSWVSEARQNVSKLSSAV